MNQLLDMDYNLNYMTKRYLTNKKRSQKQEISKRTSHPLSGAQSQSRVQITAAPDQRKRTSRKITQDDIETSNKYCNTITWRLPFRHVERDRGITGGGQADAKIVKHDPEECGITTSKALFIVDGGKSWGWVWSWRLVTRKRNSKRLGESLKT